VSGQGYDGGGWACQKGGKIGLLRKRQKRKKRGRADAVCRWVKSRVKDEGRTNGGKGAKEHGTLARRKEIRDRGGGGLLNGLRGREFGWGL